MSTPRIVVAGTHSGVGKTTVATGIMAAFRRRGLRVQGFKVGPDFIDPTFHHAATGRPSHNLDGWMLSREANLDVFAGAIDDADVAIIEGVMGLFDGKSAPSLSGTTAEMAIWLDAAVVLVLDAAAMAGSAAAIVHGFDTLVPEVRLSAAAADRIRRIVSNLEAGWLLTSAEITLAGDLRNYFTHFDPEVETRLPPKDQRYLRAYNISIKLQVLCELILLSAVGFSAAELKQRMEKSRRLDNLLADETR
jgi:hypothetical protein